jgi:hypothetical protein|tara:strand:+ start:85 stop:969 length:885 start_codon:yes stop_codon:yes gene_type:complete
MPITPYQYYSDPANYGSYQYTTLSDIVNNFMIMYVGNDKQINNVRRHEIIFYAKEAIKLLNFDSKVKPVNSIELEVGDDLKFILPSDYVNYIRISINVGGTLRPLYENRMANTALGYLQDNNLNLLFDLDGNVLIGTSNLDLSRVNQTQYNGTGIYNGCMGWFIDDCWYFGYSIGARYGADTRDMFAGPSFRINNGVIDFSSGIANQLVVLEYISDGMANGVDANINVHKFAEEFVNRYIKWKILNGKVNIPVYDRKLARDEKQAEFRNAKLRLSDMHPSRLLMSLRGQSRQLK